MIKKQIKCYKVVMYDLKSYLSKSFPEKEYSLQYKVGKWIKPLIKFSPIFVFKTLEDAQELKADYAYNNYSCYQHCRIFECVGEHPHRLTILLSTSTLNDIELTKKIYKLKHDKKRYSHFLFNPIANKNSAIGVERLKLIKEII